MGQHVGLVHQGDLATLAPQRPVERVPDHPLDAVPGVEALLGRDLGGGAAVQDAARTGVEALGALADHHEVDLARLHRTQRARCSRPEAGRPQVDVLVEVEPQLEQQPALQHPRRYRRVADRAEQDRVVRGQLGQHRVGQHLAGPVVPRGAQVVRGRLDPGQYRVQDLQALRHHLGADAVPGHDRDPRQVLPPKSSNER